MYLDPHHWLVQAVFIMFLPWSLGAPALLSDFCAASDCLEAVRWGWPPEPQARAASMASWTFCSVSLRSWSRKKKTKTCLRLERQMKTPAHIWIINTGSSDPDPTIFYFKYNIGTGTSHEGLCIVKLFLKLVPVPTPVLKFLEKKNKNIWCG